MIRLFLDDFENSPSLEHMNSKIELGALQNSKATGSLKIHGK